MSLWMVNAGDIINSKATKQSRTTARGYRRELVRYGIVLAVLTLTLLLTFITSPQAGQAACPGRSGKIAFDAGQETPWDNTTFEIYVMDADGSNRIRLTNNTVGDRWPNWSPYGQKIAFTRFHEDDSADIYVMNADGSDQVNLTNTPAFDELPPAWSPDGKKIAFTRGPAGSFVRFENIEQYEIFVMDVGSDNSVSNLQQLTFNTAEDSAPAWSPDGQKITFTSYRDGNYEIYVMNTNGEQQTNLTNNPADDGFTFPAQTWSPDGLKIAFPSNRGGENFLDFDVYVMDADGSSQTNLTNRPGLDACPAWSPDGTKITFNSFRDEDGSVEIYVMNAADGSNQTNLTQTGETGQDEVASDWQSIKLIYFPLIFK